MCTASSLLHYVRPNLQVQLKVHIRTNRSFGNITEKCAEAAWMARQLTLIDGERVYCNIHTHPFYRPLHFVQDYPGEPVPKPIWILLKQDTVSGSSISWAIYKFPPHHRLITIPAPHHSVFYRPDALPVTKPTASNH